jgi:hypothetical protein
MVRARVGRRLPAALGAVAVACAAGVPAVAAQRGEPVVVRDGRDARSGVTDLTRAQLGRASDGRLRGALTLAAAWRVADLLAEADAEPPAPPGSLCLRLWTAGSTRGTPADYLVCVTADARGERLRGVVLREADDGLVRVASAAVSRTSARTVSVRFAQSAIGRPARVRFAAETTRPGCVRTSCVDTAPDAPRTATLVLRSRSEAT